MKKTRRSFVQRGALLGGGIGLLRVTGAEAGGAGERPGDATLDTLHALHSTHGNFTDRPVPEELVRQILQASVRAANASNMQSYSIVVVGDPALVKAVCGYRGPRMLLFCVDFNRLKASAAYVGLPYHPDSIVDLVTGSVNTALAAQTAVVAARALGVDSLVTNGIHRGDMERVWRLLDLPETSCFPLVAVVLGYATEQPKLRKGRVLGPGVIHEGKYHHLTKEELETLARQYDDPGSQLALEGNWREGGRKHYFEWLFGTWLARSARPTTEPTPMLRLLARAGFVENQRS